VVAASSVQGRWGVSDSARRITEKCQIAGDTGCADDTKEDIKKNHKGGNSFNLKG